MSRSISFFSHLPLNGRPTCVFNCHGPYCDNWRSVFDLRMSQRNELSYISMRRFVQRILRKPSQMRSDMDHTVSPANYTMPAFTSQPQNITALWLVLIFYRPTEGRRLSRPGWLVTYRNKVPPPGVEPGRSPIPVLTGLDVQ